MIIRGYFNLLEGLGFQVVALYFQPSHLEIQLTRDELELTHAVDIVVALDSLPTHDKNSARYAIVKNRPGLMDDFILERFKLFMVALDQEMEKF